MKGRIIFENSHIPSSGAAGDATSPTPPCPCQRRKATKAKPEEARQQDQLVARFPRGSIVAVSRRGQSRRRLYDAPVSDLFAASRYINRKHGEHLAFPKYVDHLASFAIWTCENANHFSRRNGDPAAPDNRI